MAVGSKRTVIRDMFLPRLLAPPPLLPPPREAVVWSIAMVALSPRCDVTVEEEEEEAKVARGGPWPRRYAPAPRAHATRPNRLRESALGNAQLSGAKIGSKVAMVLNVCVGWALVVDGVPPRSPLRSTDYRALARAPPRPWGEKDVQPGSAGAAAPAAAAGRRVKQEPFQFDDSQSLGARKALEKRSVSGRCRKVKGDGGKDREANVAPKRGQ
ncbi:hypothetical protein PCL_02673 [Purpureocillium lilacinum]|uniref:Uncharacterized protein n=1 Tax=Purpureocillium lilacinum TaxID=33203 RepID=A0A2U3DZT8_PURLI|nr:hypothetical protein PCL_02673 [Purpureocillium lilacinum]